MQDACGPLAASWAPDPVAARGHPSVRRALETDPQFYTDREAVDGFRGTDRNDNDLICIKDVFEHSNAPESSQGFYYYVSTIDDNVRS